VVATALFAYRRPESPWAMPSVELAVLATLTAVALGITELPDRSLLVPALAVAGAYAAVVGVVTRRREFLLIAPLLLCAAWLTFATEALTGNPEWVTVPIGVTILVVNGLLRATLRERGEDPAQPTIAAVDLAGMGFVVGAALVQTIVESLWYGVLAVGLGVLVAAWGIVTRVRRRALFGSVTVVLAVVLLIGIPLTEVALTSGAEGESVVSGPALWIVIAAIGLVAIMVAAFLEQGRQRVRAIIERVSTLTRDWE